MSKKEHRCSKQSESGNNDMTKQLTACERAVRRIKRLQNNHIAIRWKTYPVDSPGWAFHQGFIDAYQACIDIVREEGRKR
jgi:hypothetical protein